MFRCLLASCVSSSEGMPVLCLMASLRFVFIVVSVIDLVFVFFV